MTRREKNVQPIRDKVLLEKVKNELLKQSYRDWFMFVFGINTGLRIGDILQLKVKDVKNKTHIVITEQKTDKKKIFSIKPGLRTIISEYVAGMDDDDYLFPSRKRDPEGNQKPISTTQAYRVLDKVAKKLGLDDLGTHTMRKTFGYFHYQQYKDVAILQELFNHSAPSVTLRYIGVNQDILDQSVNEMELL